MAHQHICTSKQVVKILLHFFVKNDLLSPTSPHQGLVGCMIKKGKDGWITLCFHIGLTQWFKMKNLQ